jgi:hypothetical protein
VYLVGQNIASMNNMIRLLAVALLFCFASCTTREELEIKADGSGKLAVRNDMSALMEMVKSMDTDGKMSSKDSSFNKKIDSVIYMKDMPDTAKVMNARKKALLKDGTIRMQMHGSEGILKMDIEVPYKSTADLQELYSSVFNNGSGFFSALDNIQGAGRKKEEMPSADEMGDKLSPFTEIGSVYDVTVKNGLFSRTVNKQRYEAYKKKQAGATEDSKGMSQMFGAMEYVISIKFPQPVKKISNTKAELSTDKLNVLLKGSITDMMESPESMELQVEY